MIFCKDISWLWKGEMGCGDSGCRECRQGYAREHRGVIHHVSTQKMMLFSVIIGLLHLALGT
ncbi:hypothetical protein [Prevotella intermedia]|uniref:hypothetical protein n=1 Tax=Prevotella intermedia TaxID=28131 RepID=UPI0012FE2F22|nr:hypothetical protein [Prevotella intermedia]